MIKKFKETVVEAPEIKTKSNGDIKKEIDFKKTIELEMVKVAPYGESRQQDLFKSHSRQFSSKNRSEVLSSKKMGETPLNNKVRSRQSDLEGSITSMYKQQS